jgi:TATA-box binding protein (TBP) (component of TFIID and TFIIIB)
MKAHVEKYVLTDKSLQKALRLTLIEAMFDVAGLEEDISGVIFRLRAKQEGSYVTVTLFEMGNLIVTGHGPLFDLTHTVCSLYHKGIPTKQIFGKPARKSRLPRKTVSRKATQPSETKEENQP